MAYTGPVGIMPGAATEKLPFIHSNFKPNTKLAKCFAGVKRYTGQNNAGHRRYRNQKLPQIRCNGFEEKKSFLWEPKSGRSEYPGFVGKKSLKRKDQRAMDTEDVAPTSLNKSNSMKPSLSLPNLSNAQRLGGNFINASHDNGMDSDVRQRHASYDYEHEQQRRSAQGHSLDSLIFFDEDTELQHNNDVMVAGHSNSHHGYSVRFRDDDSMIYRFSPSGSYNSSQAADMLAKGLEEKLRITRGKSGMKRGKRREPDHARMLGDVITAERMHELLKPRKEEGPLQFEQL